MVELTEWHLVGSALVTEQSEAVVRHAELVYADDTGWKENGRPLSLRVFTCAR